MTQALMAVSHLLRHCANLHEDEDFLVVTDDVTRDIAELVTQEAARICRTVSVVRIPPLVMHGQEPPPRVAERMCSADVILALTQFSLAHTAARRASGEMGARFLSLPDYTFDLLEDDSVLADFRSIGPRVGYVADHLDGATTISVTSAEGTAVTMSAKGRRSNACPGFVDGPGQLGSPPDAEANVSPIEESVNGRVIVDGSIPCPSIGLLAETVELSIVDGLIIEVRGPVPVVDELWRLFNSVGSDKARLFAECGVGLNDRARLTGKMLTDEGAAGTMHFGFGSNATVGGRTSVPFHLDFVFRAPSLVVDGVTLLENGVLAGGPETQ